ncbi:MAG: four helix bundle protein [Pyrinomonadaceae bacterium]
MKRNTIQRKSFEFSLLTIELYKKLLDEKEFILSKQLLRSGASIGANIEEATAAQSRKDFLSKVAIASKEARETKYWLRLLNESSLVTLNLRIEPEKIEELIKILTSIVKTTSQSLKRAIKNSKLKTPN